MITPQNRIIIVDDETEELNRLSNAFLQTGIGCRTFEYENTYNSPLKDIRIAFFDVNLGEENIETNGLSKEQTNALLSKIYNQLAFALNQYISKENGPYALVFWTKNKSLIEGFTNFIENPDRGYSDTAKPFLIECFDKNEIDETNVVDKLKSLFSNDKIKFYIELEENARIAGSKTIDKLHSIIPKDTKWSDNSEYFNNIDKVLSKIAVNVLGYDYAKEQPLKGIYEGLSQLVLKEFLSQESQIDPAKLMTELESKKPKELLFPNEDIQAKLNSIYHITDGAFDKDYRGVIIELDKTDKNLLKKLNIKDESIDAWFNLFIPFNNKSKAIKKVVRDNSKLVCCEISSACDFSNKKQRKNKYILGFITPTFDVSEHINEGLRPESSYNVGGCDFWIEDKNQQIWFNLNYVFSSRSDSEHLGEVIFSLNKEIMDMIGNKYANHVSRIGITSF